MARSYGSITIVDIGDLGQLSVTPESNQPATVIYDPDNNSYNPDWTIKEDGSGLNLYITPVVMYGTTILLDDTTARIPTHLTIKWKYQIGNSGIYSVK